TMDPVSGIVAVSSGYVRDPFGTCPASMMTFTLPACGLNNLAPAIASGQAMLDQNAIKLLGLYPKPTNNATGSLLSNFADTPATREQRNAFDSRMEIGRASCRERV